MLQEIAIEVEKGHGRSFLSRIEKEKNLDHLIDASFLEILKESTQQSTWVNALASLITNCEDCLGKRRLLLNHVPGLILYSVDSGNRADVGGNPTTLFLLFLIRQAMIIPTVAKLDSVNNYVLRLQEDKLSDYFLKGHFEMVNFHLDKIKAQKNQIIEDAFLIYRTNLAVVDGGSKKLYFRLVEEVAGLERSSNQTILTSMTTINATGYTKNFSKTLLTEQAYNEIALTLMLWQQISPNDSELKAIAEGYRQFTHTQFNQGSIHLVECISQLFNTNSLSFI